MSEAFTGLQDSWVDHCRLQELWLAPLESGRHGRLSFDDLE